MDSNDTLPVATAADKSVPDSQSKAPGAALAPPGLVPTKEITKHVKAAARFPALPVEAKPPATIQLLVPLDPTETPEQRIETLASLKALSEDQLVALEALLSNKGVKVAATRARVNPSTVWRWTNEHRVFREALKQWRKEHAQRVFDEAMSLSEGAIAGLREAIESGTDPQLCLRLLKELGMLKPTGDSTKTG